MAERYKKLYRLSPNLYTPGSPVILAAGALLQDTKTGKLLAQLKIKNIQAAPLKMVTAEITPRDPVGRPLGKAVEHKYMDLQVSRDASFGTQEPIPISEADARSIEVRITEVCFADNTVWSSSGAWTALPELQPIETLLSEQEMVKQYQLTYGANAKYRASAMSDLWYCTCGEINRESESNCHRCRKAFAPVSQLNLAELEKAKETRLAEEARQRELAEEKRKAEAEKARNEAAKRKKQLGIFLASVTMIAMVIYIITQVIVPNIKYKNALEMMEAGSYPEAIAVFEELDGYRDSAQQITLCETGILDGRYAEAVVLMEAGSYAEAIAAFEALDGYKDSAQQITLCETAILDNRYADAVTLMEAGSYPEAIAAFEALDGYKDSVQQITRCETGILDNQYAEAVSLREAGNYTEALAAFEALDGYKDSVQQITRCETAILENRYADAVALMESGKTVEAYEALVSLNDYKDSAEKAASLYEKFSVAKKIKYTPIGGKITFGIYEQDNDTSNGAEAIQWRVLAKEENRVLVISEYALETRPYNEDGVDITYEACTLRRWLNEEFYNTAFTSAEQAMIPTTMVKAQKNPSYSTDSGRDTEDKVFLLSIQEAKEYFPSDEARKCAPTAYAKAQGADTRGNYKTASGEATCWWWLRSPGDYQFHAASVINAGSVYEGGYSVRSGYDCVRPAMWIDLDS